MSNCFYKSAFACIMMLFCLGIEVNAQKKLCLQEIETLYEGDYTFHGYNKDGLLDSTYMYKSFYDEEVYFLYDYDSKGNMVKQEGYCILPENKDGFTQFSKAYEIVYEFDEQNRKVSRKNYNLDVFGGTDEMVLGGCYFYTYNEKGLMTESSLYWDEAKTNLYETTVYEYDENDRMIKETKTNINSGEMCVEEIISYSYDNMGRLTAKKTEVMDHKLGEIVENGNTVYTYDMNNNLVSRLGYVTDPAQPFEEHRLTYYTDTLATEVAMPINYEDDMDFFTKSTSVVKQDSIFRRNVETDTFEFELFDIENWKYVELSKATGIDNVMNNEPAMIAIARDNEGNLVLNGVANNEMVRVYDANGRMVSCGAYNGKVNVNNLPGGMYIVSTRNGNVKFTR